MLQPATCEVVDLDKDSPMLAAMEVSDDEEDEHPLSVLAQRRALQQLIAERTLRVPTHRLRRKTPRSSLQRFTLVYRDGMAPRRGGLVKQAMRYRVMFYKRDNCIAIRQCLSPKWQVGSSPVPHGMTIGLARWVAQQVRLQYLELDNTWEPYTSDLLQQLLMSAPDQGM